MATVKGIILYDGPSQLDGKPIVVLLTGLSRNYNPKTGDMLQTWILRSDAHPRNISEAKEDSSICGNCPHRHSLGGKCYVNLTHGPSAVYRAYLRGNYTPVDQVDLPALISGRMIRFGSYGDPAAAPIGIWLELLRYAAGNTGYTHQWRTCDIRFREFCMASCDSLLDFVEAQAAGWRTFTVGTAPDKAVVCPASKEAGRKLTCASCKACCGTGSGRVSHITLQPHGFKIGRVRAAVTAG